MVLLLANPCFYPSIADADVLGLRAARGQPGAAGAALPRRGRLRDQLAADPRAPARQRPRKVAVTPPLFPSYAFVLIELQWHAARWCPGVLRLVLSGAQPAKVPDHVIAELRGRERNGLITLPPPPDFQRGDRVRITRGVFAGQLALFDGMRAHERVEVLLQILGRVELPKGRHRQRAGLADSPLDPFQALSRAIFWKELGPAPLAVPP